MKPVIFKKTISTLALFAIGYAGLHAQDNKKNTPAGDSLKVGDPAPPIAARKWIKGNPVTAFKPGMVYVVEFWATWCGPCQSAMPHLSELARKYRGKAEVLSFDVREDKKTDFLPKVEQFVKWSGTRMDYTVAVDAESNVMVKTWLDASGSAGIPALFIVDRQGKIVWYGHPNHVDDVLEAVVNGQYDEAAKQRIEAGLKMKEARYDTLSKAMMAAKGRWDYQKALAIVEDIFPLFPGMRDYFSGLKYQFLNKMDPVAGRKFGDELMAQYSPRDQINLANLALLTAPDSSRHPDYSFALKWAKLAAAKSDPDDKSPVQLLAQVYYYAGDKKKAVEYQEKLIQMIKNDPTHTLQGLQWAEKALEKFKGAKG